MSDRPDEYPEDVDPDESPFAIAPIAGLPFGKNSEEARAIREVIAEAERGNDPDVSPFAIAPIAGLPFGKDSEEARAIREILAEAASEQATAGRRGLMRAFRRGRS